MTRHWRTEDDADGIRWLIIEKADSDTNVLSQAVLWELAGLVEEIVSSPPAGVVIKSGKDSGFIAGADITEFSALADSGQAEDLVKQGHRLLNQLENLPCPTVAAIHGFALGGGMELALACDYRVAVQSHKRNLGLPEVQLGIHPGLGGTVRSVRLLGAPAALKLMLTGKSVSAVEARRMGLLDRIVPDGQLDQAASELVARKPRKQRPPAHLGILQLPLVRPWLGKRLRAQVRRRAQPEHYPAPFAIVDLWVRHGGRGQSAYEAEARSIARLLRTSTSRHLVRVFFLRERLRGLAPKTSGIKHVHVAGAGVMGGDIAAWCALRGFKVTLHDQSRALVEPALERAQALFERRLRAPGAADDARRRLVADTDGFVQADLVIEAIVEKADAKQDLYRELESRMRADAVLATNTSSIDLERLSETIAHRGRFLGLHFFNPVARLPLVEVVRSNATDDQYMARAMAFVNGIGKLPLPCRNTPGFLVNRILAPYLTEALFAHHDGYPLETIDRAAEDFGMPMGPVELADRVGLDVVLHAAESLGTTSEEAVAPLRTKVQAGELGAKSGAGFYRFRENRPVKSGRTALPDKDLQDRLILPLLNAAVACYADGVVDDPDLVDAGVVFGTGFAPFRGGPIQYARLRGIETVVRRMESFAASLGPRFHPHPDWAKLESPRQSDFGA